MALSPLTKFQKIRVIILGVVMLLFAVGVIVMMRSGPKMAPVEMGTHVAGEEDFGQFLVDHYALLGPFFERHKPDLLTQSAPLVIRAFGDLLLMNMAISWVLGIGAAMIFSYRIHRKTDPVEAVVYSTYRVALDAGILFISALGAFGWELLGVPVPVIFILILFLLVEILSQSILVASSFHTTATSSTIFYVCFLIVLVPICGLISGSLVKKRLAVLAFQFADVPAVSTDLEIATVEAHSNLLKAIDLRDKKQQEVDMEQAKLDKIKADQEALRKLIEEEKNSEAFVYGYIIRIRASGDLEKARDQMTAFLEKFPNGKLAGTAKAQLEMIKQEIVAQAAKAKQDAADAAQAAEEARKDLLARAAVGQVRLEEMRHALLGKSPDEVTDLLGKPERVGTGRWDYTKEMIVNPQTEEKSGLTVYFNQGTVQSVDYFRGQ